VFNADESLSFRTDKDCPSIHTFSEAFQKMLKAILSDLLPDLPMSHRSVYNSL
jgi:hypothetical protein